MGAALCQLPERCVYKIEWGRAHSLSPLSLSFMHRVNCVVSKAHGASDEGSRRLGSRIWLQYWSKREQVRDRPTHSHTYAAERDEPILQPLHAVKGLQRRRRRTDCASDDGVQKRKTHAYSLLCCWQAHVIRLHLRVVHLRVFAERQEYIMLTLSAGWARIFLPQPQSAQPCTRQFWETHTWFFIYCLKSLAHKNCPWCLT